jgi:hypothetical protein
MSRQCKTKASKGQFRPQGDKGREMVTRGGTKDLFLSGLKKDKKTFDNLSFPSTFHFIGSNDASDKNQKPQ